MRKKVKKAGAPRKNVNKTAPFVDAAGGYYAVAEALGLTHQAVRQWRRVPEAHVRPLAKLAKIPMKRLRPDLYGPQREK